MIQFPSGLAARPGSFATALTAALGLALLSAPAHAGDVSVKEGEKATFQITVTKKPGGFPYRDTRIRVYYAAYGGTATKGASHHGVGVDGADYSWTNPWVYYVQGQPGQPLTISVQTFRDDLVEGDETFKIKVVGIKVPGRGWWHNTALSNWNVKGLPTKSFPR
ncbi:MAG: hypothetical protein OXD42_06590 [Rhodospirillaceae bacterium]|nr:hypothetical protein [Rhodospirillaceae bacterium]